MTIIDKTASLTWWVARMEQVDKYLLEAEREGDMKSPFWLVKDLILKILPERGIEYKFVMADFFGMSEPYQAVELTNAEGGKVQFPVKAHWVD